MKKLTQNDNNKSNFEYSNQFQARGQHKKPQKNEEIDAVWLLFRLFRRIFIYFLKLNDYYFIYLFISGSNLKKIAQKMKKSTQHPFSFLALSDFN